MRKNFVKSLVVMLCFMCMSGQSIAAWYQAQGQAIVLQGDIETARRNATEEAIREALLFSGASVASSQTLVNGLLSQDAFHVNASGEVRRVEKVNEVRVGNYLTVTIRADIFSDINSCSENSSFHTLVTAPFVVLQPGQLLDGNVQNLSMAVTRKFHELANDRMYMFDVQNLLPFSISWDHETVEYQARSLGSEYDVQVALFGRIEDAGIAKTDKAWYSLGSKKQRHFQLAIKLVDTVNGAILLDKIYTGTGGWEFKHHQTINPMSSRFWEIDYGTSILSILHELATDIEQSLSCQPSTGRILKVLNNQVNIALGRYHGLNVGDTVTLYQKNELFDQFGRMYFQYNIHPEKLVAVSVNVDNAIVEAESGGMLGNIQASDFVTIGHQ